MARIAKSIRAAIDHFLRTQPHSKPFSIFSGVRKTGIIAGVVHKKPISDEQMRRLFD